MKHVLIAISILPAMAFPGTGQVDGSTSSDTVMIKTNNAAKNWTEQKTTLLKHLKDFEPSPVKLDKFGGRTDHKEKATGFFHTKKTDEGWVMVDPEGCHYLSIGVCSVDPHDDVADHKKHFQEKFSDRSHWAGSTRSLLVNDLKFNSLGCWSDWKLFKEAQRETPYVRQCVSRGQVS